MRRERIVSRTLMAGVLVSGTLLVIGFVLYASQPEWYDATLPVFDTEWLRTLHEQSIVAILLNPYVFLYAGIFVLMLTPILRLLITGWTFAVEADWHYVGITVLVLLVIGLSIVFSIIH
ncbi:MAG: DUF1634 domain-containing protein [Bacteroidetes bacterium]|nr:DUF1634 domain-containing protein [Bacteroidota bacterium]